MRSSGRNLAVFLGLAWVLVGCGASQAKRLQGNWLLEKVRDYSKQETALPQKVAPMLIFDNGTVTEIDGAARYKYPRTKLLPYGFRTNYTVDDGQISIGYMKAHITELSDDKLVYLYGSEYTFRRVAQNVVEQEMKSRFGTASAERR